jgi:hypothetical protein
MISPIATRSVAATRPVKASDVETSDFVGWAGNTYKGAVAVFPVPPLVETTVTVLVFVPILVPVTITVTVQLPLGGMEAPFKLTSGPFAAAVTLPPEHVVDGFGVPAFCTPDGYVSVNATPSNVVLELGLVMVNVRVDVPFIAICTGEKLLPMFGSVVWYLAVDVSLKVVPPKAPEAVAVLGVVPETVVNGPRIHIAS